MKRMIALVAAVGGAAVLGTTGPSAFSIHEHKYAGDRGARAAFTAMESKKPAVKLAWMAAPTGKTAAERWVTRPSAKELAIYFSGVKAFESDDILLWVGDHTGWGPGWATFGDLVAIYGDHKPGVESLNSITATELQKLQYNARKSIDEATINLLHLASMNSDHFSEDAVLKYRDRHKMALDYAKKAVIESDIKNLWRAMHHEAFAVHALTDLFAAGHMFLDRRKDAASAERFYDEVMGVQGFLETLKAAGRLTGVASDGVLSRLIHDCFNNGGVQVKTLEDRRDSTEVYRTSFGDGNFFKDAHDSKHDMVDAVQLSVSRVLQAYVLMLEKADAAGTGAARIQAAEAAFASIGAPYYGALRKIPVTVRKARCVVGGITVAESTGGWRDLPYRSTVAKITNSGS